MPRTGTRSARTASGGWELSVLLRREPGGSVEAVERVVRRDHADARSEFWFEALARRGAPEAPPGEVAPELIPLYFAEEGEAGLREGGDGTEERACAGFGLVGVGADGEPARCYFLRSCLPTVNRALRKLVAAGTLGADETCYYELRAELGRGPESAVVPVEAPPVVVVQREPVPFEVCRTPLAPLLAAAEVVAAESGSKTDYPVFYTRHARARAEQVARKGAQSEPSLETGGLLVGPLGSCPETGEMFAVVVDVLEAEHAEATTHSLTFSAETWARFQAEMRARGARPATRHHRILGQVHGHSFLPLEGVAPCAECPTKAVCTRSSAFLSEADISFCKSLFPAQPWQLSHVFGLDALGRGVEAFYGQKRGQLVRRGYRLIESFEPTTTTTTSS